MRDAGISRAFYTQVLGFEALDGDGLPDPDGKMIFYSLVHEGSGWKMVGYAVQ